MSTAYIQGWCEYILTSGQRDKNDENIVSVPVFDRYLGTRICEQLQGMKSQPLKMSFEYTKLKSWHADTAVKYTPGSPQSWEFMMGLYDACGDFSYMYDWKSGISSATCSLTLSKNESTKKLLVQVLESCGVPGDIVEEANTVSLEFKESNCLDVLIPMYKHMDKQYYRASLYDKFTRYITERHPQPISCKVWRTDEAAVVPTKAKPSDVGYDLTIVKKLKNMTNTCTLYDTCIRVQCPFGMYAEVVPRSSLSKSGYMLANSVGIIDPSYTGNIMIALVKVDPEAPDLTLPFRCCQLIFRKQEFVDVCDVTHDDTQVSTARSEGGFGSSG